MALFRCGGGGLNLDLMNPDVTKIITSSKNGTTNIPVTQKPRYIIVAIWGAENSVYNGMLAVLDVEGASGKNIGYYSNSAQSWADWSTWQNYFTSITTTNVTYKAAFSTSYATRNMILIYY